MKKGLKDCFLCDEKYMPGHICKFNKQMDLVSFGRWGGNHGGRSVRSGSVHDNFLIKQSRVTEYHEKKSLQVLIDTGSTHNFID